jgi:hypothetical protein
MCSSSADDDALHALGPASTYTIMTMPFFQPQLLRIFLKIKSRKKKIHKKGNKRV